MQLLLPGTQANDDGASSPGWAVGASSWIAPPLFAACDATGSVTRISVWLCTGPFASTRVSARKQPGLYRQAIAPYCGSCHFDRTGLLHLASFANLMDNKQRIQKAVCTDFTMPHSQVAIRRFRSDGGVASLPGLLSTALGDTACPQWPNAAKQVIRVRNQSTRTHRSG